MHGADTLPLLERNNMKDKLKNCWRSRIVWVGTVQATITAAQLNLTSLEPVFTNEVYGIVMFCLAMAQVILRFDTTKPLDEK